MFVPHGREYAELGEARRSADQTEDALIFVGLQPMRGNEFGGDRGFVHAGLISAPPCQSNAPHSAASGPPRFRGRRAAASRSRTIAHRNLAPDLAGFSGPILLRPARHRASRERSCSESSRPVL